MNYARPELLDTLELLPSVFERSADLTLLRNKTLSVSEKDMYNDLPKSIQEYVLFKESDAKLMNVKYMCDEVIVPKEYDNVIMVRIGEWVVVIMFGKSFMEHKREVEFILKRCKTFDENLCVMLDEMYLAKLKLCYNTRTNQAFKIGMEYLSDSDRWIFDNDATIRMFEAIKK